MRNIFILVPFILLMSCSEVPKVSSSSWHGSMRGLAKTLSDLMPTLVTKTYSNKSQDKIKIKKALAELSAYSKSLDSKDVIVPSQDPSLAFIAEDFKVELRRIKDLPANHPILKTQESIRDLSRYCVACHTRTQASSSHFSKSLDHRIDNFNFYDQATYLTAIRQYEKALVQYEKALTNREWAQKNPKKWSAGAMNLLAILVRVKKNPNLTLEMLSQLFDRKSFPSDLNKAARVWQSDAKEWEKDKQKIVTLVRVQSFLDRAKAKEKLLENSGLLLNLRASSELNEYLRMGGKRVYREQIFLFHAGVIAKRLEKLNFSGFPNSYFKACVSVNPKSAIAKSCKKYLRLN